MSRRDDRLTGWRLVAAWVGAWIGAIGACAALATAFSVGVGALIAFLLY